MDEQRLEKRADETQQRWFASTLWSVVARAAKAPAGVPNEALEQLCGIYWAPIYTYIRHRAYKPDEAKDLTQEFFRQLIQREALVTIDPAKGRFRSFLLASVNNFLANEWRRANALKRGGGRSIVSMDDELLREVDRVEIASPAQPDAVFDRQWAFTIMRRAMQALEEEFQRAGKREQWSALHRFLTQEPSADDYAAAGVPLETKPATVAVIVYRMRQRFRELVRREVADTVETPDDLEEEIRYLLKVLAM